MSFGKVWAEVDGWLSVPEADFLRETASNRKVLEVGCYKGRSTLAMLPYADHVTTVDWFMGDADTRRAGSKDVTTLAEAWSNLQRWRERLTIVVGDMRVEVPRLLRDPNFDYEFLFYDALHSAEATKWFLELCNSNWKVHDLPIAVHDYRTDFFPHVVETVDAFVASTNWEITETHDSLAVLRRDR